MPPQQNGKSKSLFIIASVLLGMSLVTFALGETAKGDINLGLTIGSTLIFYISTYFSILFFVVGFILSKNKIIKFIHILSPIVFTFVFVFLKSANPLNNLSDYIYHILLFLPASLTIGYLTLPFRTDGEGELRSKFIKYLLIQLIFFGLLSIFPLNFFAFY